MDLDCVYAKIENLLLLMLPSICAYHESKKKSAILLYRIRIVLIYHIVPRFYWFVKAVQLAARQRGSERQHGANIDKPVACKLMAKTIAAKLDGKPAPQSQYHTPCVRRVNAVCCPLHNAVITNNSSLHEWTVTVFVCAYKQTLRKILPSTSAV